MTSYIKCHYRASLVVDYNLGLIHASVELINVNFLVNITI